MKPLPVLLSIPHGGSRIPEELKDRLCIEPADLFDDSDACTQEIFDLGKKVVSIVETDIARAFVDVNRAPSDRPPANPNGVVKSAPCYDRPIYAPDREPGSGLVKKLLKNHYHPFHARLQKAARHPELELALDCHSMAGMGPAISPDPGRQRPTICLGDLHGRTCSRVDIEELAECFCCAFSLPEEEVAINHPFSGGYIIRTYGAYDLPWVQVEISRSLYLADPWFDRQQLTVDEGRLRKLKSMFETALRRFVNWQENYVGNFSGSIADRQPAGTSGNPAGNDQRVPGSR